MRPIPGALEYELVVGDDGVVRPVVADPEAWEAHIAALAETTEDNAGDYED